MKKVRKKSWLTNALSFALALCITVSSLLCTGIGEDTMVVEATTSAKSRVQTFIGLAAGKSGNSLPDIGQLTQDELQFLGVYLSNFYVPFSTELGVAGETDKFEEQKGIMVQALSSNMNFNETVCKELVENIIGLSRSNCYQLEFGFASREDAIPTTTYPCSYWDFVNFMLGNYDTSEFAKYDKLDSSDVLYRNTEFTSIDIAGPIDDETMYLTDHKYSESTSSSSVFMDYVNFVYKNNNGECIQVGSAYQNGRRSHDTTPFYYTASQIAFFQCIMSTDSSEGYVFNVLDVHEGDVVGDSNTDIMEALYDCLEGNGGPLSEDDIYEMSAYGNKVYIDCFGNIIRYSNNHQTVIMPGCMNPYSWVTVDSNGIDVNMNGKKSYMGATIQGLSLVDKGVLISPSSISNAVGINDSTLNVKFTSPEMLLDYLNDDSSSRVDGGMKRWYSWTRTSDSVTEWGLGITHGVGLVNSELNSFKEYHIRWNLYVGNSDLDMPELRTLLGNNTESSQVLKILYTKGKEKGFKGLYLGWRGDEADEPYEANILEWGGEETKFCGASMSTYFAGDGVDTNLKNGISKNTFLNKMCFIDNLGAFGFDSSNSDIAYDAITFQPILSDSGSISSNFSFINGLSSTGTTNFGSILQGTERGKINILNNVGTDLMVSLYTTYAIAGLYDDSSKSSSVGKLGYRINRDGLPKISNSPLLFSQSYADETVDKEIRNMIYYLLKPDAVEYVKVALKNKLQAILVDWHNDMVGTSGTGYTTGTTYYRTNYGYVTTPDLSEMQWTASLLNLYDNIIPMLVIFMVVSMLIAFITGTMSLQRAVLGTLVFSAFLLIPTNAINFVVEKSNSITNNIYGEKFIYWAVVQEETYGTALDSAATGNSYENYIKTLYSQNAANQGGESIVVKWQAPKKMASLMLSSNDKSLLSSLQGNLLTGRFLNNALSGEAYLDGESQYLYRDYSDLANMSRYIYHSINSTGKRGVAGAIGISGTWESIHGVQPMQAFKDYVNAGYTNGSDTWSNRLVLSSMYNKIYNDATSETILDNVKAGRIDQNTYLGINQDLFNISVAYFNNQYENDENGNPQELYFDTAILNNATSGNETGVECLDDWFSRYPVQHNTSHSGESDWNSLIVYGIMSESPFYYFSWNMYDDVMDTGANASGGYRAMLLSDRDGGYFYNMGGNGELKDFMNIRNLFYHVIPYLKKGNDIVRAWDERYGVFVYDGVPTEEGYLYDHTIQSDDTLKYKYWHNLNVARLYEIYTPWVDLMYDCSYAEPCYVKVMGEKIWIEDPLDPWSYPDERPMIFSESEMYDYGLTEADLTEVERNILKFNREAQEDMYELLNYYNFSDLSLNTAAAMECTFIFNQVFSESGLFSSNINLYPQSFEIKDFSYDAFLRFILSTTTGESMSSTQDFYGDVVKKSSTTTAILLIVCDVLSQYVMPFAKIVFLLAIFISSILLIMVTVFKVDPEFKFVGKLGRDIFLPLIEFFAITVIFAYVISLFMGTGNNAVTQSADLSISLGDPNMVLVAMCIVNLVCIVLYVKLLMGIWSNIKTNASLIKSHVTGLVGGVVAIGAAGARAVTSGIKGSSSSGGSYNEGTGKESARATARSSKRKDDVIEKADMGRTESERMAETKRTTMKTTESKSNEKRSDEINGTIKSGKSKVNSGSGDDKGTK